MDNYYFHMDNLSVGYNRKALIHDICIGIKKGEIVTLIGPNGSGKSTILKSITRQLQIIGGKVYFDNQNLLSFTFRDLSTRSAFVGSAATRLTSCFSWKLGTYHAFNAIYRYAGRRRGEGYQAGQCHCFDSLFPDADLFWHNPAD